MTQPLVEAARELRDALAGFSAPAPVTHVYHPLEYAWALHRAYLEAYGTGRKRVVFLGMNPGPWGMAQTGVPFGQVAAVRDYLKLEGPVGKPEREHPKRPVLGLATPQSEVSGARLWGAVAARYPDPCDFFAWAFVANYCPLSFMSASGANVTPDKLDAATQARLMAPCDAHLRAVVSALAPEWVIGVGAFAEARAKKALGDVPGLRFGRVLHPSPASPAANRDWAGAATRQLVELGVCPPEAAR